jgi:hypothetical protein
MKLVVPRRSSAPLWKLVAEGTARSRMSKQTRTDLTSEVEGGAIQKNLSKISGCYQPFPFRRMT